jgi:hypothetical protein
MDYPDAINDAIDELEARIVIAKKLTPYVKIAEACAEKFKDLETVTNWRISVNLDKHSMIGVLCFVDTTDMRDIKHIRRWLRIQGGMPAPKMKDYPEIKRRSWSYGDLRQDVIREKEGFYSYSGQPYFTLGAFLPFGDVKGQTCQYVKVGVEESPVYELRCDNETVNDDS